MATKRDAIEFRTERSVQDLGRALQSAIHSAGGESAPFESPNGALAAFDDPSEIAVVARGRSSALSLNGYWAVEIFVFEEGPKRLVRLAALGDGGFTRAIAGSKNTLSLGLGVKKRDSIARTLR